MVKLENFLVHSQKINKLINEINFITSSKVVQHEKIYNRIDSQIIFKDLFDLTSTSIYFF